MPDPRTSRPHRLLFVPLVVGLAIWAASSFSAFGCGAAESTTETSHALATTPSSATSAQTTTTAAADPITSTAAPAVTANTIEAVFADLAQRLASIPVYRPTYLPADAALAAMWWPVVELERPSDYRGAGFPNPRVDEADGLPVAAQVLFAVGEGWLAVLENYRGDLGDVAGQVVGEVEGNRATLYSVNGGTAIQWSERGLWFVVFGRNLPASEVTKVALSMGKTVSDPTRSQ